MGSQLGPAEGIPGFAVNGIPPEVTIMDSVNVTSPFAHR